MVRDGLTSSVVVVLSFHALTLSAVSLSLLLLLPLLLLLCNVKW